MRHLMVLSNVLLVLLAIASSPARASTGNELLRQCGHALRYIENPGANVVLVESTFCLGKVSGALDMDALHFNEGAGAFACPPRGVTTNQAIRVVVGYLERQPARLHLPAIVLIRDALRDSYPCAAASGR